MPLKALFPSHFISQTAASLGGTTHTHTHTHTLRARPYHRMKLMLVGKAARGKTTLLMKISERGQRGVQENWGTKRCVIITEGPWL